MKKKLSIFLMFFIFSITFSYAQTCNDDFCEENSFSVFCDVATSFNSESYGDDGSIIFNYIEGSNQDTVILQETFTAFQRKEGDTFTFDNNEYEILYENNTYLFITINGEEFSIPPSNFQQGNINSIVKIDNKEIYYLDNRHENDNFVIFIKPSILRKETFNKHESKDFLGKKITYLGELGTSPISSCKAFHFLESENCIDYCTPEYGDGKCEYGESIGLTTFNLKGYFVATDCEDVNCGNGQCEQSDYHSCRTDCSEELCGDNQCEDFEFGLCDEDCGTCGNNKCEYSKREWEYCGLDCSTGDVDLGVNILYANMTQNLFGYTIEYNELSDGVLGDNDFYYNKSAIFEIKNDEELVEIFNSQDKKIFHLPIPGLDYKMYVPYGASQSVRFLVYEIIPFEERTKLTFGKGVKIGKYELVWGDYSFHVEKGIIKYGLFIIDTSTNRKVNSRSRFDSETKILTYEDINLSIKFENYSSNFYNQNDVIIISPITPIFECGNNVCEEGEISCCIDCGCEQGFLCLENECIEEQCSIDEDCNDENPCTNDLCTGSPKVCNNEIFACNFENECFTGELNENKYCSNDFEISDKKELDESCENNFECITGNCEGVCSKTQEEIVQENIDSNLESSQIIPENYVLESKQILKNEEGYRFEYTYEIDGQLKKITGSADLQGNIIESSFGFEITKYFPHIGIGIVVLVLIILVNILRKKKPTSKKQTESINSDEPIKANLK